MSRASQLLYRLDRFGHPAVNEQTPEEENSDDALPVNQKQEDEDDIDPEMTDPNSPFSRVTHNTDGSMKSDQDDQPINDKGKRFVMKRKR